MRLRSGTKAALSVGVALGAAGSYWGIAAAASAPGRRIFRRALLSSVRTTRPEVGLTFDDGPDPDFTQRFLVTLGDAPATFFSLGEQARRWPALLRELTAAGHEVASHGDTHRKLTHLAPAATREELRRGRAAIVEATGTEPRFFRPAHGLFNLTAWIEAPRLGMRRTLWSASARDWEEGATPDSIAGRILAAAEPGAILLMHDSGGWPGRPARTLAAIPAILDGLRDRGLRPVTLTQLVA